MLVLATAALAEVGAERFDPVGGGSHYAEESGPGKSLFQFRNFRFHYFAPGHERDENDKIFHARHPLAPEGDIANRQGQLVA